MILGYSHKCDLNRSGIKGHLRVIDQVIVKSAQGNQAYLWFENHPFKQKLQF